MLTEKKSVFFFSFLLLCALGVNAQTSVKQVTDAPKPRTTEVQEQVWQVEREAVSPAEKDVSQQAIEKKQEVLQEKAQQEIELQKAQETAAAKERELESKKVINPNWRNQKSPEQLIMEARRAEVEAINQQEKQQREAEIKATELQLQQTTDEGIKQKLLNKINNLRNNPTETGLAE
ncbi:MAG: hypothetical protein JNM36_16845 [Chitinophagales bacterium]|nr:hypothetical protein [Chitinophagales bacterium]